MVHQSIQIKLWTLFLYFQKVLCILSWLSLALWSLTGLLVMFMKWLCILFPGNFVLESVLKFCSGVIGLPFEQNLAANFANFHEFFPSRVKPLCPACHFDRLSTSLCGELLNTLLGFVTTLCLIIAIYLTHQQT